MTAPGNALPMRRTWVVTGLILLVIPLTRSRDLLAEVSRPLVIAVLKLLGTGAEDGGEVIRAGRLEVPWSRDCDGVNLLFLLFALALWVNRREPIGWRLILRVGAMIPAAIAANILRILTLIGYRAIAYPAVESPQTHYFIGFAWLIPFLALVTPGDRRPLGPTLMETVQAAAVMALLAPVSGSPNGTLVLLSAIIALTVGRGRKSPDRRCLVPALAWVAAGLGIAILNVESFWIPWLLICPLLTGSHSGVMRRLSWLICLACTHPLVAMQPWSWGLGAIGLALFWISRSGQAEPLSGPPSHAGANYSRVTSWAVIACLAMPFLASSLLPSSTDSPWTPPEGLLSRELSQGGYEVRLSGQPDRLGLVCYPALGRDRHHTVEVCLKYRGVELIPGAEHEPILTEGRHWYREYFLMEDELLDDYASYLRKTFRFRADPGVHLIFVSPREDIDAADFATTCKRLAEELQRLSVADRTTLAGG